jgi:Fe-S cluster assembly ATP-binding protein
MIFFSKSLLICNLNVSIRDTDINVLQNINLKVKKGTIHFIIGPNGSGKSTLAKTIAGHPAYRIKDGFICFKRNIITSLKPEFISKLGIFLAFQYPLDLPVTFYGFLLVLIEQTYPDSYDLWLDRIKEIPYSFGFTNEDFLRNMNEGFSGGERKKTEIIQMLIKNPELVILDEIDSGVDIDSLNLIIDEIKNFLTQQKSLIFITHYLNIMKYIKPDFVHIMNNGSIIKTGSFNLLKEIINNGYSN